MQSERARLYCPDCGATGVAVAEYVTVALDGELDCPVCGAVVEVWDGRSRPMTRWPRYVLYRRLSGRKQ